MTQPKARCVTCLEVIWSHDTAARQRPKFCNKAMCRAIWKDNPICVRCRTSLPRPFHSATRYHEDCAVGCAYCGGFLMHHERTTHRKHVLRDLYCSTTCRDAAWEGQPLPICPACEQPVPMPEEPQVIRNPPAYHHDCRPDSKKVLSSLEVNRTVERWDLSAHYYRTTRKTYTPFEEPRLTPDGPEIPFDFTVLPRTPDHTGQKGGIYRRYENFMGEQPDINLMTDEPLIDEWYARPFVYYKELPTFEIHDDPDHDADLMRGSWATESEIMDRHPLAPPYPRVGNADWTPEYRDPRGIKYVCPITD